MAPTLSIIVPVYNTVSRLEQTVSTILTQTFTDFELILVDDGSTDGSGELCDAYADKDKRVVVIHKANGGVSSARNSALDIAQGEYIGWVDSDDLIEPDMYSFMTDIALKENADVVQCNHDRCVSAKFKQTDDTDYKIISAKELINTQFVYKAGRCTNYLSLCSKIFRRTLFNNIRFPVGRTFEDHAMMSKIIMNAKKIAVSQRIVYHYIERGNSIITARSAKRQRDKEMALFDNAMYLENFDTALFNQAITVYRVFLFRNFSYFYNNHKSENEHSYFLSRIKEHKKLIEKTASAYDKLYINLVCNGLFTGIIAKHEFEPIQKLLQRIKGE